MSENPKRQYAAGAAMNEKAALFTGTAVRVYGISDT
jgi:hypothetical protein